MPTFSTKSDSLPWARILDLDVAAIAQDPSGAEDVLEGLFEAFVTSNITSNPENLTPENLIKVFQLSQLAMELKHMYLEEAESQIQTLESTIASQDEEISSLHRVANGDVVSEFRRIQEENKILERRNESTINQLKALEEQHDAEKKTSFDLGEDLKNEKSKSAAMKETVERLHSEVDTFKVQIDAQKAKAAKTNFDEEEKANIVKDKNQEIKKYLNEIQLFSQEFSNLQNEMDSMTMELEATVTELETVSVDKEELERMLVKSDNHVESLTRERDTLKLGTAGLSAQAYDDTETVDSLRIQMSEALRRVEKWKSTVYERDQTVVFLTAEAERYKAECEAANTDVFKREIREKEFIIQSLRDKLTESYRDFELLSMDWDKINAALASQSPVDLEIVHSHMNKLQKLKSKALKYREEYNTHLSRSKDLEVQLEAKESLLVESQALLSKFESGTYGLAQAIREIKDLKAQRGTRDSDIKDSAVKINDLTSQLDQLLEENYNLRDMLGITEPTQITITSPKASWHIDFERSKSMNITLQEEIRKLEEERLQLKAQTRLHALQRGDRAVEFGLSVEELIAVEEYADRMRSKDYNEPDHPPPMVENRALQKITNELGVIHAELRGTRTRYEALQTEHSDLKDMTSALEAAIKDLDKGFGEHSSTPIKTVVRLLEEKNRVLLIASGVREGDVDRVRSHSSTIEALEVKLTKKNMQIDRFKKKIVILKNERSSLKQKDSQTRLAFLNSNFANVFSASSDFYALLEQLFACILELQTKDVDLEAAKISLEERSLELAEHASRCEVLGHEFIAAKEMWKKTHSMDSDRIKALEIDKALMEQDVSGLNKMLDAMKSSLLASSDQFKYLDVSRQYHVLLMTLKKVERQNASLQTSLQLSDQELGRTRQETQEMDQVARETVHRLRVLWVDCERRVQYMTGELNMSVPKSDHQKIVTRLELINAKYKTVMESKIIWGRQKSSLEADVAELKLTRTQNHEIMVVYEEIQSKVKSLEAVLREVGTSIQVADGNRLVGLEAKGKHFEKRLSLSIQVSQSNERLAEELKRRVLEVERSYLEAMEEKLEVETRLGELKVKFEGGASGKEHKITVQKLRDVEYALEFGKIETLKYKEIAEYASQQAQDIKFMQSVKNKEKGVLRAAIRELQMEGDDRLVIGQLHEHLLNLQLREMNANRNMENVQHKCLRLENLLAKSEMEIGQRSRSFHEIQITHRMKLQDFHNILQEQRIQLIGTVKQDQYDKICSIMQSSEKVVLDYKTQMEGLASKSRRLEWDLGESRLRLDTEKHLVEALKIPDRAHEKILDWHRDMANLRLSEFQIRRDLSEQNYSNSSKEHRIKDMEALIKELEDSLTKLTNEYETQRIDWERREQHFENTILLQVEENEKLENNQRRKSLKSGSPIVPLELKLEEVLKDNLSKSREVKGLKDALQSVEFRFSHVQRDMHSMEDVIVKKDVIIADLQIMGNLLAAKGKTSSTDKTRVKRVKKQLEAEQRALTLAQQTIFVLQEQISTKDSTLTKYQSQIQQSFGALWSAKQAQTPVVKVADSDVATQLRNRVKRDEANIRALGNNREDGL